MARQIMHIDLDAFFVSVEQVLMLYLFDSYFYGIATL